MAAQENQAALLVRRALVRVLHPGPADALPTQREMKEATPMIPTQHAVRNTAATAAHGGDPWAVR